MLRMRNSNPTASAHPMSRLEAFQPGMRCHACHHLLTQIAIPMPELASEKALGLVTTHGPGMSLLLVGWQRVEDHHLRSAVQFFGGV